MYTISIFDKKGNLIDIPVDEFLRIKINQTISEDKALGIKRSKIPFHFFLLPDKPQTENFCKLAQEIEKIATFNLAPDNSSQGIWMRCIQLYWQAKAILLANKIFKLISDPSIDGGYLTQILPHTALPAAMRYILKAESYDRTGARRKMYCIIAGSAVKHYKIYK
ncbi:MAG: hypothetical protein HWQ37_07890 [Nostoc sp. NMS4]|nr:hypothetical protein [Nostoc sp. NMS4]